MDRRLQWRGDNARQFGELLSRYVDRVEVDHGGVSLSFRFTKRSPLGILFEEGLKLELGDSIVLRERPDDMGGASLGVERLPSGDGGSEVTWKGDNVFEFARLLADGENGVRVRELRGESLVLALPDGQPSLALHRGDKLIKRGGKLYCSRSGQDHRA